MFNMLKLMGQLPKIKAELERLQERLAQLTAEADAGGGMVKAKVNGKMELLACTISNEAMNDREMLEDLIKGAVNKAIEKVRLETAAEASKLAEDFGLPPGMGIPGLQLPGS